MSREVTQLRELVQKHEDEVANNSSADFNVRHLASVLEDIHQRCLLFLIEGNHSCVYLARYKFDHNSRAALKDQLLHDVPACELFDEPLGAVDVSVNVLFHQSVEVRELRLVLRSLLHGQIVLGQKLEHSKLRVLDLLHGVGFAQIKLCVE